MTKDDNKIKVFASDDNLKALGELLSNETSRKIIINLMSTEMYTNEIATKLDIRVSLVIHHLRKLEELGLLEIEKKKIKRKGEKHRFFKMNSDLFITLDKTKEEIDKKGILKRIFKVGIKFGVIFIVAGFGFMLNIPPQLVINYPIPYVVNTTEHSTETIGDILFIPFIILMIGFITERILYGIKKRKRG